MRFERGECLEHRACRVLGPVQEQPVSDALEVSTCVSPSYNPPRLARIDASVEEHLVPNEWASKNGMLELPRDGKHHVELFDRTVNQDELE